MNKNCEQRRLALFVLSSVSDTAQPHDVPRLFTENRVFCFCVAYAFLYGTLGRGKGKPSQTATARIVPRFDNPPRRRFCRSHAGPLFIRIREVRTIRGSRVCFREARRSAVSSTVSTRVLARAAATESGKRDYIRRCREKGRKK